MKPAAEREAMPATTKQAHYLSQQPPLSAELREQLILEHLPQVRLIARRIHERLPESVSLDDLVSTGVVGLIAAIDRFDASHNVKLKTYAEYKIRGAILDGLRGLDWRRGSSAGDPNKLKPPWFPPNIA
jgi:RNA polymerase sigma factor (sigma-70 family)